MSKDMLGSLVRASVRLDQSQIGLAIDIVNRLTGKQPEEWEIRLKNVLRQGLPDPVNEAKLLKNSPMELLLPGGTVSYPYDIMSSPWVQYNEDFDRLVLSKAGAIRVETIIGRRFELVEEGYDSQIKRAVGKTCLFANVSEVFAYIETMVSDQSSGIEGDLSTKHWNLFYVGDCVVGACWIDSRNYWLLKAHELNERITYPGTCVFSRDSI